MISPEELLVFAGRIIGLPNASEVDARRAVSSAYYAVFHLIAHSGASLFNADVETRNRVARSYDHAAVWRAAGEIQRQSRQAEGTPQAPVVEIAIAFRRLLEARERADYDLVSEFDRDDATELFWEAEKVFALLQGDNRDASVKAFLLAPLVKVRERRG